MSEVDRLIFVCPKGCGWWEGDAHGHRPPPHGCSFLPLGEVVDMVVEVVPSTITQGAVQELAEAKAEAAAAKLVVGLMIADHTSTEAEAEEMGRRYMLKALAMRKGQPDLVRCSDCGTTRAPTVIDCPVCDVPRGHVHGRRDLA